MGNSKPMIDCGIDYIGTSSAQGPAGVVWYTQPQTTEYAIDYTEKDWVASSLY
jgi:hypothetical protein